MTAQPAPVAAAAGPAVLLSSAPAAGDPTTPVTPAVPAAPSVLTVRRRGLTIAMVGQKGLPATIGGIEHHVEQVGARLAERGHDVVVYSRDTYGDLPEGGTYRGMHVVAAPTIGTKHLDAIVHSGSSTLKAMAARADIVHYHALGPGLVAPLPRFLSSSRVVLTVHGLDNVRDKWGRAAQAVLGTAHWMSGHVPDATVVVSRELQDHYARTFGRDAAYITNGVPTPERVDAPEVPRRFGLEPGRYLMFVGRLVPEKRPDLLLQAFRESSLDVRLAVVGASSFTDGFTARLHEIADGDERIVFTGFVGGRDLAALFQHARLLVQPSDLEGLPLTLLEAVGHGCHVLASDIAPHREVLGGGSAAHRLFPAGDLDALRTALEQPVEGEAWDVPERGTILDHYSWDRATEQLEQLYLDVMARPQGLRRLARGGRPTGPGADGAS